jgi:hypothetical protein
MPDIFEESTFPQPWDYRLSLGIKHEVLKANAPPLFLLLA